MFRYIFCFLFLPAYIVASPKQIAPGVVYEKLSQKGPLVIHTIKVDPKMVALRPVHALDDGIGREILSSIAYRYGSIVALNGDFFQMRGALAGSPRGTLKQQDDWFSITQKPYPALGWNKDASIVLCDKITTTVHLTINGEEIPLDAFNRTAHPDKVTLFSPIFHRTTLSPPEQVEVIIQNGRVVAIDKKNGGNKIPEDGYVLSFGQKNPLISRIQLKDKVKVNFFIEPMLTLTQSVLEAQKWAYCDFIISGAPLLVKGGITQNDFESDGLSQDILTLRRARSVVGTLEDGSWLFLLVEASPKSLGATMNELAQIITQFHFKQALNFDGGASSELIINGKIKNRIEQESDNTSKSKHEITNQPFVKERAIADAILILPKGTSRL